MVGGTNYTHLAIDNPCVITCITYVEHGQSAMQRGLVFIATLHQQLPPHEGFMALNMIFNSADFVRWIGIRRVGDRSPHSSYDDIFLNTPNNIDHV